MVGIYSSFVLLFTSRLEVSKQAAECRVLLVMAETSRVLHFPKPRLKDLDTQALWLRLQG